MVSPSTKVLVVIDASSGVVLLYRKLTSEEPFTVNVYDAKTQRSVRGMYSSNDSYSVEDLFVCLFVLEFFVPVDFFYSNGDITSTGEVLRILTYARHLWPLGSEGSLTFHTYCDTGHPFIMVISEDPLTLTPIGAH